ncbi:hypothetical protein FOA52_012562 [Chlamydomonas sp. UWO 241]|nr:hypothetical protein FOA52_012562 [Chlamydomonas sp. UWO 241]
MPPRRQQGGGENEDGGIQPQLGTGMGNAMPQGWSHFWPPGDYSPQDRKAKLVNDLAPFLASDEGRAFLDGLRQLPNDSSVCPLDFAAFVEAAEPMIAYLSLAVDGQPEEALACVSIAFHHALTTTWREMAEQRFGLGLAHMTPPSLRVHNHPSITLIRQLKGSSIGRLVTIQGTIIRLSPTRPLAIAMDFVCGKCGTRMAAKFPDGKFTPPVKCAGQGCRAKQFEPVRAGAKCSDWRKARLQEVVGADKQAAGQVPRTLEVELWGDLTTSCMVGDAVTATGLVKVLASGDDLGKLGHGKGSKQDLFLIYLEALSVAGPSCNPRLPPPDWLQQQQGEGGAGQQKQKPKQGSGVGTENGTVQFSERDLDFIRKFTEEHDGDQLRQLVLALCPSIYGQELVKAGLLLALCGGVRKGADSGPNQVPTRGDAHVLVVGDPGLGKSQLLQAACSAAPRGVYVCGKTSSSAGLTVSVVRDALTGDYTFEAGAVVLADRGVVCIDEFDKIAHEHQALLEAMEQQQVSVAKAGLVANLPARTTVLAAANPVGGHYNRARSLSENLRLSPAMLSRFDLVFVLMDRPDDAMDQCVSEHVLALHSGLPGKAAAARQRLLEFRGPPALPEVAGGGTGGVRLRLRDRLLQRPEEGDEAPLPTVLLRKYIAYARQHVHPVLTKEARMELQEFYLQLRSQAGGGGMPVTARQLESLVRLSEARARIELRSEVTAADAADVVELMRDALWDWLLGDGMHDAGAVDLRGTSSRGSRGGAGAEAKRFLGSARRAAGARGSDVFSTAELLALANDIGLQVKDVHAFLEALNEAGDILKAGGGKYKLADGDV